MTQRVTTQSKVSPEVREQVAAMLATHRANAMSVPMQPGATWADVAMKAREIAFDPIASNRTLASATALRLAAEAAL